MGNNLNRAKQFMSFDALKGFRKLLEEEERIAYLRKDLSEDYCKELSNKISKLKKGDNIELIYYFNKEYIKVKGIINKIDFTYKFILLENKKINFKDIYEI